MAVNIVGRHGEAKLSSVAATRKNRLIAFRVTDEEYAQIERIALALGEDPNNWGRNILVAEAREGSGLTKSQRLLYEEIARTRYLVGHGFRLLLNSKESTAETWKKITKDIDEYSGIIADDLLSRRK